MWKWEEIGMAFITGFPMSKNQKDMIWVIVDRLTKSAHFLAVNQKDNCEKLAKIYVNDIVSKHGVPKIIVSDRGSVFTSSFWKHFTKFIRIKVRLWDCISPSNRRTNRKNQPNLRRHVKSLCLRFWKSLECTPAIDTSQTYL
jgi:hypothetical protein